MPPGTAGPSGCSADGRACVDTALAAADTLIFDGGEFWLPSVHSLVSSWKREFGVYIGSNFYITPPGKQAFGFHSLPSTKAPMPPNSPIMAYCVLDGCGSPGCGYE